MDSDFARKAAAMSGGNVAAVDANELRRRFRPEDRQAGGGQANVIEDAGAKITDKDLNAADGAFAENMSEAPLKSDDPAATPEAPAPVEGLPSKGVQAESAGAVQPQRVEVEVEKPFPKIGLTLEIPGVIELPLEAAGVEVTDGLMSIAFPVETQIPKLGRGADVIVNYSGQRYDCKAFGVVSTFQDLRLKVVLLGIPESEDGS